MKEMKGNIWETADYIVIPTNGFIKINGECVMGRGLAKQMKDKIPEFPKILGDRIKAEGNHVHEFSYPYYVFSFPVKHNWWEKADLALIEQSAKELRTIIDSFNKPMTRKVYIPHVGCGNGGLNWKDVKPILEKYLNIDEVVVCDNN